MLPTTSSDMNLKKIVDDPEKKQKKEKCTQIRPESFFRPLVRAQKPESHTVGHTQSELKSRTQKTRLTCSGGHAALVVWV